MNGSKSPFSYLRVIDPPLALRERVRHRDRTARLPAALRQREKRHAVRTTQRRRLRALAVGVLRAARRVDVPL